MPAYEISLSDFLKYASRVDNERGGNADFFPLKERLEMSVRICDGLLYMNAEKDIAHRDIKPRLISNKQSLID